MRYYNFVFGANSENIEAAAKTKSIRLSNYDYDSTPAAVSAYMNQNIDNDMCFLIYKEDANTMSAVFSYNERKCSYENVYAGITGILKEAFSVKKICSSPCEITGYRFLELVNEAKRRGLSHNGWCKVLNASNMDYLEDRTDKLGTCYELHEKIISDKVKKDLPIFDDTVKKELANIESHQNTSDFGGNLVHYFVSGKSTQAASDITEAVVQRLIKANRLSGRRMEIFSDISPDLHKSYVSNHFEDIIENNFGGVIVIDLSVRLGKSTADYGTTCKYIEKVVKKYKKDCLFVFTYDPDAPGFAYELLREVSKFIIPVGLKEGSGNRSAAVKYLKELIKDSEYSQYVSQAGEYMKQFSAESKFTQTDVLEAFENFSLWCINKNILNCAYEFTSSDTFMLERDDDSDSSYEKLQNLIGLESVKKQIDRIIANDVIAKQRKKLLGQNNQQSSMHMIFSGNPGTAKTTVAKLFAGIAKEKGILKSGAFVCESAVSLVSVDEAFKKAEGGVLFIDEAYAMYSSHLITELLEKMEECRESVIVILGGYKIEMEEFVKRNDGLKSRIPYTVDFPDYSVDELTEIFKSMASQRGFKLDKEAVDNARAVFEKACRVDNFGNGRFVRNCLDSAIQNQAVRLMSNGAEADKIRKSDLVRIKGEDIDKKSGAHIEAAETGTALKELDQMIGLDSVKKIIHKVIAEAKIKKMCMDKGIKRDNHSMHMLFMGNPGTAKTTVARLFAQIMKDENILPTGNFVEVGRADLVGKYVGHTAPRVRKRFREAQGGVLFIDEAYSLSDGSNSTFGDEAINTIVQEMENHREDVIVIFAGYTEPMKDFVARNPGMNSRIKFKVNFEDYTADELCEITNLMLNKKEMHITESAMQKLHGIYEKARKSSDFGNGRFARQMIEDAEMNLAERVVQLSADQITKELMTTIEESDIVAPIAAASDVKIRRIGF